MSFSVPKDDLLPRSYQRLPNGKYRGTLAAVGKRVSATKPWEGVEISIDSIARPDGSTKFEKGGEEISTLGQTRRVTFTSHYENELSPDKAAMAVRIGQESLTGVAWAIGLVDEEDDGEGNVSIQGFEFEDTEDAILQLEAGIGVEVGFTIKVETRTIGGEVQKNAEGETFLDDNIKRIFPVSILDG